MVSLVSMRDTLGQRVKQERLERRLSVRRLAAISDVAVGTLRRIEANEGQAFDHTLAKIAQAMSLPTDHFYVSDEVAS